MLSDSRFNVVSNIFVAAGQVFFASMFVGPLISGSINWPVILAGAALSLISWFFSVSIIKK